MKKDWQKRTRILEILGEPKLIKNDKKCLIHLVSLFESRGGIEVCSKYETLFRNSALSSVRMDITKFYFWVKKNEFSSDDIMMYKIFSGCANKYGVEKVLSGYFADNGACNYLREWITDYGNKFDEVCKDYCEVVIKSVWKWNKSLIQRPKSLLSDFGILEWGKWLEKNGGEAAYLLPNERVKNKESKLREDLDRMEVVRREFLRKGDLEAFDYMGQMMTERHG